jgi:hypothetical protein
VIAGRGQRRTGCKLTQAAKAAGRSCFPFRSRSASRFIDPASGMRDVARTAVPGADFVDGMAEDHRITAGSAALVVTTMSFATDTTSAKACQRWREYTVKTVRFCPENMACCMRYTFGGKQPRRRFGIASGTSDEPANCELQSLAGRGSHPVGRWVRAPPNQVLSATACRVTSLNKWCCLHFHPFSGGRSPWQSNSKMALSKPPSSTSVVRGVGNDMHD